MSPKAQTEQIAQLQDRIHALEQEVAALKAEREHLQVRESRLLQAQSLVQVGSWEVDYDQGRAHWSDQAFRLLGFEPQSFEPEPGSFVQYVHEDDRDRVHAAVQRARSGEQCYDEIFRVVRPDGATRWVHARGVVDFDSQGKPLRMHGTAQDVTDQQAVRSALEDSERRFRLIAETIGDVFWMSKPGGEELIYVSPACERIWLRTRSQLYDDPLSFLEVVHPDDCAQVENALTDHARGRWDQEYRVLHPDGSVRWILDRGFPIRDDDGNLIMMTGVATDVTVRRATEQQLREALEDLTRTEDRLRQTNARLIESNRLLERLTLQDTLTGIANRRYLDQFLEREWRREVRQGASIAIIMVDIDHFKAYNDHYGHMAGDEVLKKVARALDSALRRPADLLARYGGEEFVLVLPETEANGALHLAETLRASVDDLRISHEASLTAHYITASFGVAAANARDLSAQQTLNLADKALYQAKKSGRNCCVLAQPTPSD